MVRGMYWMVQSEKADLGRLSNGKQQKIAAFGSFYGNRVFPVGDVEG